jgi:hypothetical protein
VVGREKLVAARVAPGERSGCGQLTLGEEFAPQEAHPLIDLDVAVFGVHAQQAVQFRGEVPDPDLQQ